MSQQQTDPTTYAQSALTQMGAPPTPQNVDSILAYVHCGGDPSTLSGSNVALALSHSSPRPVFAGAVGGSLGDCVANSGAIDLASFKLPPTVGSLFGGTSNPSNPLEVIGQAQSVLQQLLSPTLWVRIGQFLLGALLLILGVYLMASESNAGQRLKSEAANTAAIAALA